MPLWLTKTNRFVVLEELIGHAKYCTNSCSSRIVSLPTGLQRIRYYGFAVTARAKQISPFSEGVKQIV